MHLESGQNLLHYRLVEKIGEGGMGVVWKAVDTTLDREVAIKILPEEFANDAERLARFEREAKLLASLQHDNIAGIYGLHESSSLRFIAMELVGGEDLAERLARGPLPIDEALSAARQIADALEVAHDRGVIHRDLKPANVKIAADEKVKVLDFGLAKAMEATRPTAASNPATSPTLTSDRTLEGVILGTAAYMSPEQARGKPVDRRADIWAFGCLLYESLTGRRAFGGETISDTLVSVLSHEPAWDELPTGTPASVRRLLRRCLTRDDRRRLRDVGEARVALEDAIAGETTEVAETPAPAKTERSLAPWLAAAGIGLVLFVVGYNLRPSDATQGGINPEARIRRLTFGGGLAHEPSLSPDGNYVAYTTDDAGNLDIAILPLTGGDVNVVVDHPADDAQPSWSPDGAKLAFVSARDRPGGLLTSVGGLDLLSTYVSGVGGDIFITPALGGRVTKLVEDGMYPTWSPDGAALAFQSNRDGQWDIWRVAAGGGTPVKLTDDDRTDYQPAWSPDGRWIAFCSWRRAEHTGLYVMPAEGGELVLLFDGPVAAPAWSPDGRWIYFSSDRAAAPGVLNLWRLRVSNDGRAAAEPQRVTFGVGSDIQATSAAGRLGFSVVQFLPDIWRVELGGATPERVTTTASSEDFPAINPDGRRLIFDSDRDGAIRLWSLDLVDGRLQPAGTAAGSQRARWSPDGERFAYELLAADGNRLIVQRWGEATPETVAVSPQSVSMPSWSPDGHRIAAHRSGIWVHTLGGESVQLTDDSSDSNATWSPDGRQIAFQRELRPGVRQIWAVPSEGGEPRVLSDDVHEYSHPQWCPTDPDRILVIVDHLDLAVLRVGTGEVERITDLASSIVLVDYPTFSHDCRTAYFSLSRKTSDLYLVEDLE